MRKLPLLILLGTIFSCWLTLIISIAIALIADKYFGAKMPPSLLWLVFGVLIILWVTNGILSSVQRFKIDHDEVVWTKLGRKELAIARNDIQKVNWRRDKIVFETAGKNHTFGLTGFPLKERVIINSLIVRWVPRHALSNELQAAIESRNELLQANPDSNNQQAKAQTNYKKARTYRIISLTSLGILFLIILIAFWYDSFSSIILPISLLSVVFLFGFGIIWQITNHRSIEVGDKEITYVVGKRKQQFPWGKIDAIYFQVPAQQILVWNGNRYKAIYYKGMDTEQLNHLAKTLEYYLLTYGIEYAYG